MEEPSIRSWLIKQNLKKKKRNCVVGSVVKFLSMNELVLHGTAEGLRHDTAGDDDIASGQV